jgi:hypothetical protein
MKSALELFGSRFLIKLMNEKLSDREMHHAWEKLASLLTWGHIDFEDLCYIFDSLGKGNFRLSQLINCQVLDKIMQFFELFKLLFRDREDALLLEDIADLSDYTALLSICFFKKNNRIYSFLDLAVWLRAILETEPLDYFVNFLSNILLAYLLHYDELKIRVTILF